MRGDVPVALSALLFAYAMARGMLPERRLAGAILVVMLVDALCLQLLGSTGIAGDQICDLLWDVLLLALIVSIALRVDRIYPLWLGGAQIVALLSHLVHAWMTTASPFVFALMNRVPLYFQLAMLGGRLLMYSTDTRQRDSGWRVPAQ